MCRRAYLQLVGRHRLNMAIGFAFHISNSPLRGVIAELTPPPTWALELLATGTSIPGLQKSSAGVRSEIAAVRQRARTRTGALPTCRASVRKSYEQHGADECLARGRKNGIA